MSTQPGHKENVGEVPRDVLLRLTHGALQHLAERSSVRLLHVKGAALHPALAEGRAPSSDCDVLVHPQDVGRLTSALVASGWERITRFEWGSVFGHAATFYSPVWGTVDVHRLFPGLDRDPRASFELLWARRESVELGDAICPVPDLEAQRLILLVHAARDATGKRAGDLAAAWGSLGPGERASLDELADVLGATVPLALVTERPDLATGGPDEHTWRAVGRGADPTAVWIARLRDARTPREIVHVLREAVRINPDHLALRLGRAPTGRERRREWRERWGRAAHRLRGAVHRWRQGRQAARARAEERRRSAR